MVFLTVALSLQNLSVCFWGRSGELDQIKLKLTYCRGVYSINTHPPCKHSPCQGPTASGRGWDGLEVHSQQSGHMVGLGVCVCVSQNEGRDGVRSGWRWGSAGAELWFRASEGAQVEVSSSWNTPFDCFLSFSWTFHQTTMGVLRLTASCQRTF